jgi:hypothetical protein
MVRFTQDLRNVAGNLVAVPVVAFIGGCLAVIQAILADVPQGYWIPLFFVSTGSILWTVDQGLSIARRFQKRITEQTVREWFYRRGFAVEKVEHASTLFAFAVKTDKDLLVTVARMKDDPLQLVAQTNYSLEGVDWTTYDARAKADVYDAIQYELAHLGLSSFKGQADIITIEQGIPIDDPQVEKNVIISRMRLASALNVSDIVVNRTLRGRRLQYSKTDPQAINA